MKNIHIKYVLYIVIILITNPSISLAQESTQVPVVYIECGYRLRDGTFDIKERGSGALISRSGHIITASHVVNIIEPTAITPNTNRNIECRGSFNGRDQYPFLLDKIKTNIYNKPDAALLKVRDADENRYDNPLIVCPSRLSINSENFTGYGFPQIREHRYDIINIRIRGYNQSDGIYPIDTYVGPGYSGGPVINKDGFLVGIIVSGSEIGSIPTNYNYMLPATMFGDLVSLAGNITCFSRAEPIRVIPPHWITSANGGRWGGWGVTGECPQGTFAYAAKLFVEGRRGSHDDTALNALRIICRHPGSDETGFEISSSEGPWGNEQGTLVSCPTNSFFSSFSIKVEPYQGNGDDTSLNSVSFNCKDYNTYQITSNNLVSHHGYWGIWGETSYCNESLFFSKFVSKIESPQGSGDDTAMNDVKFFCSR